MFIHRQMPPDKVIGCEPDSTYRTTQGEQQTLQETQYGTVDSRHRGSRKSIIKKRANARFIIIAHAEILKLP